MVTGTILAGCLENAPGQNKVPVTIFASRFWKCLPSKILALQREFFVLNFLLKEHFPDFLLKRRLLSLKKKRKPSFFSISSSLCFLVVQGGKTIFFS